MNRHHGHGRVQQGATLSARFALVVEIDAGTTGADLCTEVEAAIKNLSIVTTAT